MSHAFKTILQRVKENDPKLNTICLNNHIMPGEIQELANALIENRYVDSLILRKMRFSLDDIKALANMLMKNLIITDVDLSDNKLGPDEIRILADAMKLNSYVTSFCLAENCIGDDGAIILADMFLVNSSIKIISLSSNEISDQGAIALANAMRKNKTVKNVWLYKNNIGDDGIKEWANVLKTANSSIFEINFWANKIEDKGAIALSEMLVGNKNISVVFLDNNRIGNMGGKALLNMLLVNRSIKNFTTEDNFIDDPFILNALSGYDLSKKKTVQANIPSLDIVLRSSAKICELESTIERLQREVCDMKNDIIAIRRICTRERKYHNRKRHRQKAGRSGK